jgi:hypothetical protein
MRRIALALALVVAVGCNEDGSSPAAEDASLVVHTSAGDQTLAVQVADTPETRASGLMGRESLEPYDGMAFTWPEPVRAAFWMKNTLIPLSIAFWDEQGRIVAMFDMDPCTADPCPTYDPGVEILGAVEVALGELGRRGVEIGDDVELRGAG